ncbi:hypothetical protein AK812_SmicGene2392 [Symbiodinium microadriaticum]|uniref:Uncharacterized protein n=1 Tax=Symbiodinium microadriaticum TaxID=2951 RepID=A0A1Q9F1N9_SYMMI|nr:hypothetical protein AK812_SmicGene2392 [Symbiodinium microadriaticum]
MRVGVELQQLHRSAAYHWAPDLPSGAWVGRVGGRSPRRPLSPSGGEDRSTFAAYAKDDDDNDGLGSRYDAHPHFAHDVVDEGQPSVHEHLDDYDIAGEEEDDAAAAAGAEDDDTNHSNMVMMMLVVMTVVLMGVMMGVMMMMMAVTVIVAGVAEC